jgi:type II secretory pathway pseudopilin PulG
LRTERSAFSLIEVLVVVGLLSLIILGLVAMFSQTQRAYKLGTTQVDRLEAGRAVTDLLTRELAQMAACHVSNGINFYVALAQAAPFTQDLPGNPLPGRTNLLEDLFFLTRENQNWNAIGYVVLTNRPGTGAWEKPLAGVGSLYRYSGKAPYGVSPERLFNNATNAFFRTWFTNLSPIVDNVVHFKVRAYDSSGNWITNSYFSNTLVRPVNLAQYAGGEAELYYFSNNIVPASVELELGLLEDRAAERARSIGDATAREKYLAQQAGKVHLFRWRVPIRSVDPLAYQ